MFFLFNALASWQFASYLVVLLRKLAGGTLLNCLLRWPCYCAHPLDLLHVAGKGDLKNKPAPSQRAVSDEQNSVEMSSFSGNTPC
jgi:hypothetical protein